MPPLKPQSARIGGSVSPSCVLRFASSTLVRQLSTRRDSLMPSLMAVLITRYSAHIVIAKLIAYATMAINSMWKVSRRSAISNWVHSFIGVPPGGHSALLRVRDVCRSEHRWAVQSLSPSLACESADASVTAPSVVAQGRGTRNESAWREISLFLQDRVVNP